MDLLELEIISGHRTHEKVERSHSEVVYAYGQSFMSMSGHAIHTSRSLSGGCDPNAVIHSLLHLLAQYLSVLAVLHSNNLMGKGVTMY